MICVLKEYEIKTKMVQEQWLQLKMMFLFFYWVELTFGGREKKFGGEAVNEQIFGWWVDTFILPVGKTLYKLCQLVFIYNEEATSYTSCVKVAIFLRKISSVCVSQMYMVCIFTCLFSVCNTINLSHHEHI